MSNPNHGQRPSPLVPSTPIVSPPRSPSVASAPSTRPASPLVRSPTDVGTPARRSPAPRTMSTYGGGGGGGARDLLRKHYGLGLASATASATSLSLKNSTTSTPDRAHAEKSDPLDIDSPNFDPHAYYSSLISSTGLPGLLARENQLVSEIRTLDGERQSLVYNHHHELIAASDTIKAMKKRAESLDASLETLKAAFSEISRLGAELSTSDSEHHKQKD